MKSIVAGAVRSKISQSRGAGSSVLRAAASDQRPVLQGSLRTSTSRWRTIDPSGLLAVSRRLRFASTGGLEDDAAMPHPLLECLSDHLRGRPPRRLAFGVATIANRHRVAGTLYHIRPPMSDFDAQICERAWAEAAGAHLLRLEVLCRNWPADAPAPLVFKGADLVEHVYRNPGARAARDLDVIVPPGVFDDVVAALTPRAEAVRWPRYERFAADAPYAVGLVIEGVLIEIHTHPMPPHRGGPDGAALWARSESWCFDGFGLRRPAPLDRALLWLVNRAKDAFVGDLGDALDGALILRDLDPTAVARQARMYGLTPAWMLAQRRLRRVWDRPLVEPAEPNWGRFQAMKWALMPPVGWGPAAARGVASALRRY